MPPLNFLLRGSLRCASAQFEAYLDSLKCPTDDDKSGLRAVVDAVLAGDANHWASRRLLMRVERTWQAAEKRHSIAGASCRRSFGFLRLLL